METTDFKSALDESSASMNNLFVTLGSQRKPGKNPGLEYQNGVVKDSQFFEKIFDTNTYKIDKDTEVEFYTRIYDVMNKREVSDFRNIGTVLGTAGFTVLGVFTFTTAAIGGITGFIFGGTFGRAVVNRIQLFKSNKRKKMIQEDLYIAKLKCMLEAGHINKGKYRNNINKHRHLVEKTLSESRLALETSVFKDEKTVNDLLGQYRKLVLETNVHKAVLLSYKILKENMRRSDMSIIENQKEASRHINEVLIPYVRLIELDKDALSKNSQNKNYAAYYKIKAFFTKERIEDLSTRFPEYRATPEALEDLKNFFAQEVHSEELETQNKSKTDHAKGNTETLELKKEQSISVSETTRGMMSASPSPIRSSQPRQDSVLQMQNEDIGEGVVHHNMISLYESAIKAKSKNALDSPKNKMNTLDSPQTRRNAAAGKRFSAALVALEEAGPLGDATPDRTRKSRMMSATVKEAGADEEEKSPVIKIQSAFQDVGARKSADNALGVRDSVNAQGSGSPTKSPRKSLLQFFGRKSTKNLTSDKTPRPSTKDTKTPKASTNLFPVAESVQAVPEAQADQGQGQGGESNEAEELLRKVVETGNDQVIKWDRVITTPNITIDKVKPEDSPVVLLRCWAFIEGFQPDEIFQQIYNTEKRAKWETVTMGLREIEKISDTQHYIYFYVKTPIGISERDFVQRRNYRKDYPTPGTITMSFKSTTHASVPPVKGRIRAETYFAGYVIRPSQRAPNSTDICILSQVDIKGNIPKAIVNMAAGKTPAEWVNKLVKACEKSRAEKAQAK